MRFRQMIFFYATVALIFGGLSFVWPKDGIKTPWHVFRFPQASRLLNISSESIADTIKEKVQSPVERINKLENQMEIKEEEPDEYDKKFLEFAKTNPTRFHVPNNDVHYFDKFFKKLEKDIEEGKIVHVAHYGDSQIEGDRLTSYIRKTLQGRFGGSGPGLLPITKNDGGSYSVRWSATDNFEKFIVDGCLQKEAMHKRYGALAQYVKTSGNSQFRISSRMENNSAFERIRLFVGNTQKGFKATLHAGNGKRISRDFPEATEGASVITWTTGSNTKNCAISMKGEGEVYGVTLESEKGISVDNIPMRGSRGTFFTRMDASLFTYMHNEMNTQLIMLEFGGNAMPLIKSEEDIENYTKLFDMQLKWIKQACPDVTIVVLGPSDMGIKVDGEIQSRPFIEEHIASMRECSLKNGVAFWDMFDVMGGRNSMVKWVSQTPQLAASDYTHLTRTGATEMGKIFSNSLLNYYDYYVKHKQK